MLALALPGPGAGSVEKRALKAPDVPGTGLSLKGPKTVFDLPHGQVGSPAQSGPLNYSLFYETVLSTGGNVELNLTPVSPQVLTGVRTYIIAGAERPFSADEVSAIMDFVLNGGNLFVLVRSSGPVAELTNSFGIAVSNFKIHEKSGNIGGDSENFYVSNFWPHPVTDGLGRISVYGAWAVLAEKDSIAIAVTSGYAWADIDEDCSQGPSDPVQAFGVVAVTEAGRGKVVVVSDNSPFLNRNLGEADNRRLAENILNWFK